MTTPSNPNSTPDTLKEQKRLAENERMRLWRLAHKNDDNYRLRRNEREKLRRRKLVKESEEFRLLESERSTAYRVKHPEKKKQTCQRYRDTHKEQIKKYGKEYQAKYHQINRKRIRDRDLQRIYGITLEQWDKQFESQGNRCAICGTDKPGKRNNWSTDHNHADGEVRGILCHTCNMILGLSEDSIDRLEKAIAYLQNPPYRSIREPI
jgi:hypothetical protein